MTTNNPSPSPWTKPTTDFWQQIDTAEQWQARMQPPWRYGVPVTLVGGGVLELPIRPLPGHADRAVASLIANQASVAVIDHLTQAMASLARSTAVDLFVGLPTLGFVFAAGLAERLGHTRWVPLGYSRKFWYRDELSTVVDSITSPGSGKRIYLDPNLLSLVRGRSVLLVDDAVSSGRTMAPVWDLLTRLDVQVSGAVVAMRQGDGGREILGTERAGAVQAVFESPLLTLKEDGWWPMPAR